ncbi:MAG: PRC-barrel domain-containing protein [Microvirga sp.]
MLRKHMAAYLLASAVVATPALAQTTPAPAEQPVPIAPTTPALAPAQNAMTSPGAMQPKFQTQLQSNQIMASKLIGTTVVSTNNESIGDVNDVVVDRNGQAVAVVIGIGGFLGIGEKDVAVPFTALQFASREQARQMSASQGSANVTTTGSTTAPATVVDDGNAPDRIVLNMTKDELHTAPTFQLRPGSNGAATPPAPKP